MKKIVVCCFVVILGVLCVGCGTTKTTWTERNSVLSVEDGSLDTVMHLTLNIEKDATEKEKLTVVKEFEKQWNKENKKTEVSSKKIKTYYVVFYENDSDRILSRNKYEDGKFVEPSEEDTYVFDSMIKEDEALNERLQEMTNGEGVN